MSSYPEGINYTGVLGETGLSTGRLNYHLGELEGFLDRGEDRLYKLSTLGEKAVATLEFIKKDIDSGLFETVNTKRSARLKKIRKNMDTGFYVLSILLFSIAGMIIWFAYSESDQILSMLSVTWALFTISIIYMIDKSRKNDPEKILWIMEWLEWKLFKGYKDD